MRQVSKMPGNHDVDHSLPSVIWRIVMRMSLSSSPVCGCGALHSTPLPLSIVARPHEAGLLGSWRADSLAFVWLDPELPHVAKVENRTTPKNLAKADF
jgi:hypothetical protein